MIAFTIALLNSAIAFIIASSNLIHPQTYEYNIGAKVSANAYIGYQVINKEGQSILDGKNT